MITTNNNQRYYDGFKVVSSLKQNKKTFKYDLNQLHLEKIVAVLNQAKHTMLQPRVAHFTIFINEDFDCKTLTSRLRRVFGRDNMMFAYTVEKKNKLHIHLMLILETKNFNPATVFYHLALTAILELKNVEGCDLNPRWKWMCNKTAKFSHDLKKDSEFRDAVDRYSYFAKGNDKNKVDAMYKKFATSHIKHNNYFSILGTKNMIKIKQIRRNEKLKFNDNTALNKRYFNFRKTVNDDDDVKSMFHFVDTTTNETIGFYGYSYAADIDAVRYILTIGIDDMYFEPSYVQSGDNKSSCLNVLFFHLRDEVSKVLEQVKNELHDDQELMIITMAYENPTLGELLNDVVGEMALVHSLTISKPVIF